MKDKLIKVKDKALEIWGDYGACITCGAIAIIYFIDGWIYGAERGYRKGKNDGYYQALGEWFSELEPEKK